MGKSLVFVYGTLKSGYRANYKLESADYLGPALTPPMFKMFGKLAGFPMISVFEPGHSVLGEVYRANDQTMMELDRYEGVPHFYKRMKIPVKIDKDEFQDPVDAWIYHVKEEQVGSWSEQITPNNDGVLIWTPALEKDAF